MKIEFSENGSRIYDFFRLFASKNHILSRREENKGYDDPCFTLFLAVLSKAEAIADELEAFLFPECQIFGDFMPYFYYADYEKEEDMLNDISSCSKEKLRYMILSSLLYHFRSIAVEKEEELTSYMQEIGEKGIFSLLCELPMSKQAKWEFMYAWNEPERKRDAYIDIMKRLLPIFLEEYEKYKEEVRTYGLDLQERVIKQGVSAISDMWSGIYDPWNNIEESLPKAKYLFVSIGANPLGSSGCEQGSKEKRYYVQGFHLEKGLIKLRQSRIDSREELVFFFKNLGDSTRFQVLELIGKGVGSNKELAEALSLTTATVSYHLNYLFNAGMITRIERNKKRIIIVNRERIRNILDRFLEKI